MACLLKSLLLYLVFSHVSCSSFGLIEKYVEKDLCSSPPTFIFIYYDGENKGKCMACESYKAWLGAQNGKLDVFTIKTLNFFENPKLALRFKATQFPSFFIQYEDKFKNLSNIDFLLLPQNGLDSHQKYSNEIDAIFQNPRLIENLPVISGFRSPNSLYSWAYSRVMCFVLGAAYILDHISSVFPLWGIFLSIFIAVLSKVVLSRIALEK